MTEITIPYHLAIPAIFCFAGLGTILFFRQRLFSRSRGFWISITAFLTVYLFIVGSATYEDMFYQWDLNRYDLNKDGLFSGNEITEEQQAAMKRLINDVGRNFSFISGFIAATIISTILYIFIKLRAYMQRRKGV